MFCPKCGTAVPDNTTFCPNCASQINAQPAPPPPPQFNQQQYGQPQYGRPQYGQYNPPQYNQPGYQPTHVPPPTPTYQTPVQVTNWLVPGILVTLCCCLPGGIVTIVFACMANSNAEKGNYEDAQKNANLAQIFFWVSLGLGLVVNALYFISMADS